MHISTENSHSQCDVMMLPVMLNFGDPEMTGSEAAFWMLIGPIEQVKGQKPRR